MTPDELLSRLEGVRRLSTGWQARCPAHDDRLGSLAIAAADGRILVKCLAGCRAEDILARLGLTVRDLSGRAGSSGLGARDRRRLVPFPGTRIPASGSSPCVAATADPYTETVAATQAPMDPFISARTLHAQPGGSGAVWLPLLGQDGFVGRGLFTLLSGRPKAGKTTLLAHAVERWLSAGLRVAWLTEEPRAKWRERIASLGLSSDDLLLAFPDGTDVATWCDRLKAAQPQVIVVDTARTFLHIADENEAAQVHRCFFPLMLAARELDAALIVLHHRRKADGEEGTDHAGSHAFVGECDVAISLKEDSASPRRRELEARSRFDETPPRLLLELAEDGKYRALGVPEQVASAETQRRVRDILTADWQSTAEVCGALGDPRPAREIVRRALHRLAADRLAERQPGRGTRADRWRLAGVGASVAPTAHVSTCSVGATQGAGCR